MPSVFEQLGGLATGVASLAIVLVVAFLIMAQGKTQTGQIEGFNPANATQCQTSVACNATNPLQLAVDNIPGWIPLVIVAVIGSILLGLVSLFRGK